MNSTNAKALRIVQCAAAVIFACVVVANPFIRRISRPGTDVTTIRTATVTGKDLQVKPEYEQGANMRDNRTQMLLRIKAARDSRDLVGLAALGEEVETTRSVQDADNYASLMLAVCNALSSTDLKDDKQYVLEQKYALLALSEQPSMSVALEIKLVQHLQEDIEYTKGQLATDEWSKARRERSEIWLRTWQRLSSSIVPDFDFNDLPFINVPIPEGVAGTPGMTPDQIKDPALRAQYQSAIDANTQKAEVYREQLGLYRLRDSYGGLMKAYLIRAYSRPPNAVKELETILRTHSVDDKSMSGILQKVKL